MPAIPIYDNIHKDSPIAHMLALIRTLSNHPIIKYYNPIQASIINTAMRRSFDYESLLFYYPHITFTTDWDVLMATKGNKSDFTLIDYRLTDSELEAFELWVQKQKISLQSLLVMLAEKDYKVSFTFVENSEAWCTTVTGKEDAKFNSKCSLTTWSDDALEGLAMAVYKVFVVFDGGKWVTKTQSRRG